jgi:hypothetical protein
MDENFLGKPDFRVGVPHSNLFFLNFSLVKMTIKCNNTTPKALKLHLENIKLQKFFYSSICCYFTCAVMSRFAIFQCFFSSTILIPDDMFPRALKIHLYYFTTVVEIYALSCRGAFTTLFLIFVGGPLIYAYNRCGPGDQFGWTWSFLIILQSCGVVPIHWVRDPRFKGLKS